MRIRIWWQSGEVLGELNDTPTARSLAKELPYTSRAKTWGDEVYFELPMKAQLEPDVRDVVEPGTICFWVQGHSLALPFGPTPISKRDECRLVTHVNVLGKLDGDPKVLGTVRDGEPISVEAVE